MVTGPCSRAWVDSMQPPQGQDGGWPPLLHPPAAHSQLKESSQPGLGSQWRRNSRYLRRRQGGRKGPPTPKPEVGKERRAPLAFPDARCVPAVPLAGSQESSKGVSEPCRKPGTPGPPQLHYSHLPDSYLCLPALAPTPPRQSTAAGPRTAQPSYRSGSECRGSGLLPSLGHLG